MFRYMAFVWDPGVPAQSEAVQLLVRQLKASAPGWRAAFDVNGLKVFYTSSRADAREIHPLSDQHGVVVGDVFERNDADGALAPRPEFDSTLSAAIVSSAGGRLVTGYWGNYVAFLRGGSNSKKWVVRAPAGQLPCVRLVFRDVHVYCSLLHDVDTLGLMRFDIDWSYVAIRLASRGTMGDSGLVGVSVLQAGERHEIEGARVRSTSCWDPYEIANSQPIQDLVQAAQQLRHVTRYCVQAWASKHDSILLHLSGGLDSSIVLSCLADAPTRPTVTCSTFYSDGPGEDERSYARAAAERADCKLIERLRDPNIHYGDALAAPLVESSRPYHRSLEDNGPTQQIAADLGATALFSGGGGDQVFFTGLPHLVMIDYVHHRGIDPGLFNAAWTAAYLEQRAIWKILGQALYRGFIPHWRDEIGKTLPAKHVVTKKALDLARQAVTVERSSGRYVPEGKQRHVHSVSRAGGFYNVLQPWRPLVNQSPLLSQPLIELCLRIPTYVLTAGGRNRTLARRAFQADIPEIILRRRVKGKISKFISNVVWNNRGCIRELLCEGILAQEGFLHQDRLAHLLSDHPSNMVKSHREVTSALCLEIWLRRASAVRQRAAA